LSHRGKSFPSRGKFILSLGPVLSGFNELVLEEFLLKLIESELKNVCVGVDSCKFFDTLDLWGVETGTIKLLVVSR
jgi:hypothetical protein